MKLRNDLRRWLAGGLFVAAVALPVRGAELLVNGDFSGGLSGWANHSLYFNGSPFVGGVAFVNDGPHTAALQLTGVVGSNYDVRIEQDILVDGLDWPVTVAFDWKVTQKEPYWGVNYVVVDFHNAGGAIIGRVIHFDASNPNYTMTYFRNWLGPVPADAFYGVRKYQETFDWQHVEVSTAALPGLHLADVRRIRVRADVQNDASYGGQLLVDNLSLKEFIDCNDNGVSDEDDIAAGDSFDCLGDGIPDECVLAGEGCAYVLGDVSNDGAIDQNDVLQFALVLLNLDACGCSVQAADMNGDGVVDLLDVPLFQEVVRCHLGIVAPPLGKPGQGQTGLLLDLAADVNVELNLETILLRREAQEIRGVQAVTPARR